MTSAAIILACCLGYSGLLSMPMWVSPVGRALRLSSSAMGSIASAELGAAALVSLGASRFVRGLTIRWGAGLGLLLIGLGNLGSAAAGGFATLALTRVAAGLGEGLALTFVNASIANTEQADRYFAWSQMGLNVFFLGLFYLAAAPWIAGRFGGSAVFLLVGGAALALAALATKLPVTGPGASPGMRATETSTTGKAFAVVGLAVVFVGCQGAWAFLIAAGTAKGFATRAVAHLLMISLGVGLAGPVAARVVGRRYGWAAAVALGLAVSTVAVLVVTQPVPSDLYVLGVGGFNFATLSILTAYQSHLAAADSSGRSVAAAPSAINLGAAIGPAAVGFLWNDAGPQIAGWLIVALYAAGMSLLGCGERLRSLLTARARSRLKSCKPS